MKEIPEIVIERMIDEGIPIDTISKVLLIPEEKIQELHQIRLSEEELSQMIELWRDRLTTEEIAVRLKVSVIKVKKEMKKLCLID